MARVTLSGSIWAYLIGVYINDILFSIDLCLLLIKEIKIEYWDEEISDEVNQIGAGQCNLDTEHDILPSLLCLLSTELTLGDIVLVEANLIQFTRQRAGSDSTELIIRPTALSVSRILAAPRPPSIQVGDDFEWSV